MSTWARVDRDGAGHSLTATQDKAARQRFKALMDATEVRRLNERDGIDEEPDHLLVGQRRQDRTDITVIARHWVDLHGPDGVCTCCPRRAS